MSLSFNSNNTKLSPQAYPFFVNSIIDFSEKEKIINQTQLNQTLNFYSSSFSNIKNDLEKLRKVMGFNISEIAAILLVSRPTVYNWMEADEEPRLQPKNQTRLNIINNFCHDWEQKRLKRLDSYIHKTIDKNQPSLYDLLIKEELDKTRIYQYLEKVAQVMREKMRKEEEDQEILKKYGFKEATKEERDARLNDLDFWIS